MSRKKRNWHPDFVKYMEFIVNHPNYKGMSDLYKKDGSIRWIVTRNSEIDKKDWIGGTRKEIEDMIKQLSERLSKENLSTELEKELKELKGKNAIRSFHTSLLVESPKFADIIFRMKWLLLINKTKTLFWTSDSPTHLHNEIDHWPYGSLGLTKIGIEMHLPLTQRIALVCCDPLSFVHEPNKKVIRDFRHLIRLLSYQVYSSTRFLFSNDGNFQFAQTVIRENPLHRDPDRKRTTVS